MILAIVLVAVLITTLRDDDLRVSSAVPAGLVHESVGAFESLDNVLARFVNGDGRVDYESLRKNPDELTRFIEFLKSVSPGTRPDLFETENDEKAFWINAYNALVIMTVVDHPGIASIRQVTPGMGIFWRKKFIVGGRKMTLHHIENRILRRRYRDPRIHFAINCASESCPPLGNQIVTGDALDEELERKAAAFIQNPRRVRILNEEKEVWLPRIFKWYKKDFTAAGRSLLEYVLDYLPRLSNEEKQTIISDYRIRFDKFDWGLNATSPPTAQSCRSMSLPVSIAPPGKPRERALPPGCLPVSDWNAWNCSGRKPFSGCRQRMAAKRWRGEGRAEP